MLNLFGGTISSLEKGLSYSTLKNKAIANNIANVDTPNYKAQEVSFKKYLAEAQQKTGIEANRNDSRHYEFKIQQSMPGVYRFEDFRARHNGNGVNMDAEQVSLADNQIYYNALIDRISGKFNTLNTVIKGGK